MASEDKSLELLSRFSLITNRLRYCGPKGAYKDYLLLLKGEEYDKEKIKKDIRKYEGLFVYLEKIAKHSKKDMFDYEVIESYFLGNKKIEGFSDGEIAEIIKGLSERGLPKSHADSLIKDMPKGLNPSHSFNVLYVGVGKTTGSVLTNIMTMNKCMISKATVLKIREKDLIVSINPLVIIDGKMIYGEPEIQNIEYQKEFFPMIKVKDEIAVHWDYACKKLTKKESENLIFYAQKNIDALNRASFFSSY